VGGAGSLAEGGGIAEPAGVGAGCARATPSTSSTLASPRVHPQRVRMYIDRSIFKLLIGSGMDKGLPTGVAACGDALPHDGSLRGRHGRNVRIERQPAETQTAVIARLCNGLESRQRVTKNVVN